MFVLSWSILEALRKQPEILKDSMRKRFIDVKVIDLALDLDIKWRAQLNKINSLRHEHNLLSEQISKEKEREKREELLKKAKELLNILTEEEKKLEELENKREEVLLSLPNLIHDSVPIGPDESYNVPIRYWGKAKVLKEHESEFLSYLPNLNPEYELINWKPIGHADMLEQKLGYGNTIKAGEVAGSRFYYLYEDIVWLDFALILFAIDHLTKKGYKLVVPPYMIRGEIIKRIIDIQTFKDAIYEITGENLYLNATAEHPIIALHANEDIDVGNLPLKYVGFSTAFRKEAGAYNRDVKGIFRVHQFNKVEQVAFTLPEDSWEIHEELIKNAEELFQSLELPYRIVNIASGDLGACAAKKYDLEVWMPAQGKFREMVSCSNCLDWQSYRLKIRYIDRKKKIKGFIHTLNSTAIATTRTITAILENHQTQEGYVRIPKILRRYLEIFERAPKDYIIPRSK